MPHPVVAVVGNTLPLKLIPTGSDRLPVTITAASATIAVVEHLNNRIRPNFATFDLRAVAAGRATLSASPGAMPIWGPFPIQVLARLALPDAASDAGLLTRLLLAEPPNPVGSSHSPASIVEAMTLMRVVLQNRAARPSARWGSAGATSLGDVVRATGQFAGFGSYPTLSSGVSGNIASLLAIANDASDARQPRMRAHVVQTIALASGPRPADPTDGKLFWWRTEGSGAPGIGINVHRTVAGNTFYEDR